MVRITLFILILLTAAESQAQWVAVSGIVTTKVEAIAKNGSIASTWKTTSSYSRSSSGSILTQRIGRSGKPASGVLLDYGNTRKAYSLLYRDGQVRDLHHSLEKLYATQPPSGLAKTQQGTSLGKAKVDGIDCFIVPLYDTGPNRSRILIGKAWLAPTYNNLVMREEYTRAAADGSKRHILREMKIMDKAEPDPNLFSTEHAKITAQWSKGRQNEVR